MAHARRAATIFDSIATLRSAPGPELPEYAIPLDLAYLYSFSIGSPLLDDGRAVIVPTGGGTAGAWIRVVGDEQGADLGNANASIAVGGGRIRRLPVSTLSQNITLTFDPTNAQAGDEVEIDREDVGAYTVALVNGGTGGGTMLTLPVSARSFAVVRFDGTNFKHRRSALML